MSNENERLWYKNPAIMVPIIVAIIGAVGVLLAACLDLICTGPQLSTIQGVVTDAHGMPVAAAVVEIDGLSATTDASGVYVIRDVSVGMKTITLRAPGTEAVKRAVRIAKGGEIIVFDIALPPLVAPIPTPSPTPSVEITYPASGAGVEIREIVRGISQNIPEEQAIWVVIYPHEVSRYYPQDYAAEVQANGLWLSSVFIGTQIDAGKQFDIIAVLVDKKAQGVFSSYLGECKEKKSWPGLERLPQGTVIYARITVTRK